MRKVLIISLLTLWFWGNDVLKEKRTFCTEFLLGYRYFILGNHFTAVSNYGFTDDYHTIQKKWLWD